MVYNSQGQLVVYGYMIIGLCINGYLTCAVLGEEHDVVKGFMLAQLQEVMEDADVYGWKCVKGYHPVWRQHIGQGRAAWEDEERKIKLRRVLVWNRDPIPSPPNCN